MVPLLPPGLLPRDNSSSSSSRVPGGAFQKHSYLKSTVRRGSAVGQGWSGDRQWLQRDIKFFLGAATILKLDCDDGCATLQIH